MTLSTRATLLPFLAMLVVVGCDSGGPGGGGANCIGGKCDGVSAPPALEAISLAGLGACWGVMDDSTTDPFFQVHELRCDFHVPRGLIVDRVYTDVRSDRVGAIGGAFEGEELDSEILITRLGNEDFPLRLRVTIPMRFQGSGGRTVYWGFERAISGPEELAGLTVDAPMTIDPPFVLYPVVLWPSVELASAWESGDAGGLYESLRYEVPITSAALAVGGPSPATAAPFERSELLRAGEVTVRDLTQAVRMLPAPITGFAESPSLRIQLLGGSGDTREGAISGPGYYLVAADGTIALTAPESLPLFATDVPATLDGGTSPMDDGSMPVEPVEPVEPVDPCMGACAFDQVCVGGACLAREGQTQSTSSSSGTYCNPPTASCDPGEDFDCAPGHACAAGTCRRLSCQLQLLSGSSASYCQAAAQPCEESTDCDVGHACVSGLCRRLSCQMQPLSGSSTSYCQAASQPCEDSLDCAEGHACVAAQCRRLSCQIQPLSGSSTSYCQAASQPCATDGDCADGHACAAGMCRRLACQIQPFSGSSTTTCQAASQACDDNTDCAEGHVCEDALCKRVICLPR